MSKTTDGHDPSTCNYNNCKANSDAPCPYLSDERRAGAVKLTDPRIIPYAEHVHKYTIAVEWFSEQDSIERPSLATGGTHLVTGTVSRVTKLRCNCGGEVSR